MFTSIISNTKWCHSVGYPCDLMGTCVVFLFFVFFLMADVIAIVVLPKLVKQ